MKRVLIFLAGIVVSGSVNAQALSPWEYNEGEGLVTLKNSQKSRSSNGERLPLVYDYAVVPAKNDSKWKPAPVVNGQVNYGSSSSSILDKSLYNKFTHVDFTYFRAFLDLRNVPQNFKLNNVTVTIGEIDDQARMLVFNSAHPNGTNMNAADGKRGGKDITIDFTSALRVGEINTFVIIQVDDNPGGNTLKGGVTLKLNNNEVKPTNWKPDLAGKEYAEKTVALKAKKFKVNAFSVNNGQGRGLYFFGVRNGDNTGRIVKTDEKNIIILQIESMNLGNNQYAFKILNYPGAKQGESAYLVAKSNSTVSVEFLTNVSDGAKFISHPAFTKAAGSEQFLSFESKLKPGFYLRHSGFVLRLDQKHPSELYKQDASWMIQEM